jgi:UDP-N-acetylmuramate--alanine ligase
MDFKRTHFIGLGGIGMSACARILLQRGCSVQGSDASESALLTELKEEGASVQVGHSREFVEEADLVVYSTDIKEENVELARAKELGLPLLHRSDCLHLLMEGKKPLLVTGTHGKTTTSALLASILVESNLDPSFVVGGIVRAYNTNAKFGRGPFFVAEADESDGSFLKTAPFGAIVTNLENEHMNYWLSEANLDAAFAKFFSQVEKPNLLFWCIDDERLKSLKPRGVSYGFSPDAELKVSNFQERAAGSLFDIEYKGSRYSSIELSLYGAHNALNASAAFGLALELGIDADKIRRALFQFGGAKRRLELKGEENKVKLFDDYGHHPTEIRATLKALRGCAMERRLVCLFQPHRYTRVRDLFESFSSCFDEADLVLLTDIYSAGEAPIEGVTTAALYASMREKLGSKLHFFPRNFLEAGAASLLRPLDVALTIGAGDITRAGDPILELLKKEPKKLKVALLFGGTSAEHEVSLMSAANIAKSLDAAAYDLTLFGIAKSGEWVMGPDSFEKIKLKAPSSTKISAEILSALSNSDVAVPIFHGPQGEDGMMQGLLDALQIPYVGCDYRGAALCMQKSWTKKVALLAGIPTAPFIEMEAAQFRKSPKELLRLIDERLSYPVWVKAVHLGSSLGVSRARNGEEVLAAANLSFSYDDALIVEEEIRGRQIEFSVLGNDWIRVAECGEILCGDAFYDYETKYGSNAAGVDIPARLTPIQREVGRDLAERAYIASGCKGLSRVDFFLDEKGNFWLNEINPFPGFTNTSGYPKMWEASGVGQSALWDELIALAFHRSRCLSRYSGAGR